jgi:hypothetical protein
MAIPPSKIMEFTPAGAFVGHLLLDFAQGAAYGLAIGATGQRLT